MNATSSRTRHKAERVAIECLINGAKLQLLDSNLPEAEQNLYQQGRRDYRIDAGEQTNALPTKQTTSGRAKCKQALEWLQLAKLKAIELQADGGLPTKQPLSGGAGSGELQWIGDLHKQMATIHWLMAQCARAGQSHRNQLELSIEHAFKSQVSIPAEIYLAYADMLSIGQLKGGADDERAKKASANLLRRAIQIEQVKRSVIVGRESTDLGRLHCALSRLLESLKSNDKLDLAQTELGRAMELDPDNPDYLTAAGRLAYQQRSPERSETFYMRALGALQRQLFQQDARADKLAFDGCPALLSGSKQALGQTGRRKLGSAHTNYGAILQVNGRLEAARQQYRHALDCDPNNQAASSNLQRLQ